MRLVQSAGLWIRFWDSLQASKSPQKPNNSNVINMHVCLLYAAYHVHNIYCIKVLSSIQLCLALKLTGLMASSLSRAGDHGIFGHPKPAVQACRIPRIFQGFWAILSFQNLSESFRIFQNLSDHIISAFSACSPGPSGTDVLYPRLILQCFRTSTALQRFELQAGPGSFTLCRWR
jgi:hypothetical protein